MLSTGHTLTRYKATLAQWPDFSGFTAELTGVRSNHLLQEFKSVILWKCLILL
jgi:hypothetical protein